MESLNRSQPGIDSNERILQNQKKSFQNNARKLVQQTQRYGPRDRD